ncbi:MAG: ComF family protein [Cohnella sp.]|nr:ComF family protein [Cohnella sp.]
MSMLDRISHWFAGERYACPMCGQRCRDDSPRLVPVRHPRPRRILQALCGTCRSDIPWITHPLCLVCGRAETCGDCARRKARQFEACRCAVRYDERMRDWLARYKYRGNERLAPILAAMLAYAFESRYAVMSIATITSVPLSPERLRERGFNQSERLAELISEWYGIPYMPMLRRIRHTEKQSLKTRRNRVIDMRGNFESMKEKSPSTYRSGNFLLLDDVYTTGSTIDECARIIRGAHPDARIYGLAWAR